MLDIRFVRENPEIVKENIKKKFQDSKLPLVDEVIALDEEKREAQKKADELRSNRNKISKEIGNLMAQGKKEEGMALRQKVKEQADELEALSKMEAELSEKINKIMMTIPNIIDESVPIGRDDSENVEIQKYGDPAVPDYEIPYHTDIMEKFDGIDLDAAGKVAGNGFYYLMGDIARLHSAVLAYARDFMINRGFTYCIPPFMIRSAVVDGVMSFAEMDAMMYKIEGEDLYLIGTSEHSMQNLPGGAQRLRQINFGQDNYPPAREHCRTDLSGRQGYHKGKGKSVKAGPGENADHLPGPLFFAGFEKDY